MKQNQHTAAQQVAEAFLRALESRDLDRIMALLSWDIVVEIPLSIDGGTDPWFTFTGAQQVRDYWAFGTQILEKISFSRREFTVSADATTVFCEAEGDMWSSKGEYRNVYVFRFDIAQGRIIRLLEYGNPVPVAAILGSGSPGSRH